MLVGFCRLSAMPLFLDKRFLFRRCRAHYRILFSISQTCQVYQIFGKYLGLLLALISTASDSFLAITRLRVSDAFTPLIILTYVNAFSRINKRAAFYYADVMSSRWKLNAAKMSSLFATWGAILYFCHDNNSAEPPH